MQTYTGQGLFDIAAGSVTGRDHRLAGRNNQDSYHWAYLSHTMMVVALFRDLHQTLCARHRTGVVIGDFNDLNVLVLRTQAYLIDADSFQFSPFF